MQYSHLLNLRLDYGGLGPFCSTHGNIEFFIFFFYPFRSYISLDRQKQMLIHDIDYVDVDKEIDVPYTPNGN